MQLDSMRQALVNLFGGIAAELTKELSAKDSRQLIAGTTLEELLRFSQDEDGLVDFYAAKPILKACSFIFRQRAEAISSLGLSSEAQAQYERLANELDALLEKIK